MPNTHPNRSKSVLKRLNITHAIASQRILAAIEEGRMVQSAWHQKAEDGRELACLLGSISPKVSKPADCNGDLMPMWLADLTPTLFDGIAEDQMSSVARRYGTLINRWHVLSADTWSAILVRVLIKCIDDAVDAARPVAEGKDYWPKVVAACDQCKAAIGSGDKDAAAAYAYAAATAYAAAYAAATAYAAAYAYAAANATAAAYAATANARKTAFLRIFNFVLDQIELECNQTKGE